MEQPKGAELLHQIQEVTNTMNKDQVNRLLSEGWVLLAVAPGQSQTGPHDYTPEFGYCLGRPRAK